MNRIFHHRLFFPIALIVLVAVYSLVVWGPALGEQSDPPSFPANIAEKQEDDSITIPSTPKPVLFRYVEIIDSCGPHYNGACVNMRSGPGETYPVVSKLRTGMVLKVKDSVTTEGGKTWYELLPDDHVRYPERVTSDWYVSAEVVRVFYDDGSHTLQRGGTGSTIVKTIVINRSLQELYAYENGTLVMQIPISTGKEFTPTPRGTFTVYKMTPSRYMQGPLPGISDQYYDLPGVPWNLYFTNGGAAIHGAYWHDNFGQPWSHGCVNLPLDKAKELYLWAEAGMSVTVKDS
ncbi:MAG: L,D-transpeptidase family protein [Patescibacteria group bacterium]